MNTMKTTLLLGALTGLLLFMGQVVAGRSGMTAALMLAGVMNFAAFFWSDKIVLRMYRAQPVSREQARRRSAGRDAHGGRDPFGPAFPAGMGHRGTITRLDTPAGALLESIL